VNGNAKKLAIPLLVALVVGIVSAVVNNHVRVSVIETNRYTRDEARQAHESLNETWRRQGERIDEFMRDFSPRMIEKKIDSIEVLVREIRAWQLKHLEEHGKK
jgi:hypothetical protein